MIIMINGAFGVVKNVDVDGRRDISNITIYIRKNHWG